MKNKIKSVLLIDDNEPTNYLHKMIIDNSGYAEHCVAVQSGQKALDYLISNHPQPDLIFLDINMPGMNGWEFLEAYNQLDELNHESTLMTMLTTSLNPDDEAKAEQLNSIDSFITKPLTREVLQEIMQTYESTIK